MQFTPKLAQKAFALGFPFAKLNAMIEYNPENSSLSKSLGNSASYEYSIVDIVKLGVVVSEVHKELIEWKYVKDIY